MTPGAYRVLARTTVHFRRPQQPLSGDLTLALLTWPPDADGAHAKDLAAEGYERQPIELRPPAGGVALRRQLSGNRISFGAIGALAGKATHAAIYNADGDLIAYSFVERVAGAPGPDEVVFDAGMVEVRF